MTAPYAVPAPEPPRWTLLDKGIAAGSGMGLLADWLQTQNSRQRGFGEMNPILGSHPSSGAVNAYFGLLMAGQLLGNAKLSPTLRRLMNVGILAAEVPTVLRNRSLGIGFSAPF